MTTTSYLGGRDDEEQIVDGHLVLVHYDISDDRQRNAARESLRRQGFARLTDSVYGSRFSREAWAAAEAIAKRFGIEMLITTPLFPTEEQRQLVLGLYEEAFEEQFYAIEKRLHFAYLAIMGDEFYFDENGIPRTFSRKHLLNRLNDTESNIRDLEESLAKRHDREPDNQTLELLSLRLREASRYGFRLRQELMAQKSRKMEDFKE
jgi:CRISPR/Cas system-associated endoribonuclease Cas2